MNIETKKLQVELMRVSAARGEYELKILEALENIERIKKNIEVQNSRIEEIKQLLSTEHGG